MADPKPAPMSGADILVRCLINHGVDTVFAYPGDGINAILGAWGRAENNPRFVQSRHEEMSAFEAVGYAKFGGRFGVCMATSGPGAIHLLNGLYDAKLDHVPVVAMQSYPQPPETLCEVTSRTARIWISGTSSGSPSRSRYITHSEIWYVLDLEYATLRTWAVMVGVAMAVIEVRDLLRERLGVRDRV